jgi:hypothetical protein
MKRSVLIAVGVASAVTASLAQSTSGVEQEILKLEQVYDDAFLKKTEPASNDSLPTTLSTFTRTVRSRTRLLRSPKSCLLTSSGPRRSWIASVSVFMATLRSLLGFRR